MAMHTMLINKPPDPGSKTSRHPLHQGTINVYTCTICWDTYRQTKSIIDVNIEVVETIMLQC